MVSHSLEQESLLQNPIFDALYCEEERFDDVDDDLGCGFGFKSPEIEQDCNQIRQNEKKPVAAVAFLYEHDLFWEDEELVVLLSKEKNQDLSFEEMDSDGSLKKMRNEGIKWMLKVIAHYGFNAMTAVLAVNYYHRFITSVCFQREKPWMSQLAAVACVSIAAKVEETQVPLLLDFQVEESKYVFEAKTIQRMEILVLSTLQWKMNPVTPISFFDHIVRRFALLTNLHWEFLKRCEKLILSIITDYKLVHYLPSTVAAATMIHVIRETEHCDAMDFQNQIVTLLGAGKEKLDDCLKLISEVTDDQSQNYHQKRRHESVPSSPSGVIDAYFSSDSSNDSWAVASSVSLSPEHLFKRRRTQDQRLSFAPLSLIHYGS